MPSDRGAPHLHCRAGLTVQTCPTARLCRENQRTRAWAPNGSDARATSCADSHCELQFPTGTITLASRHLVGYALIFPQNWSSECPLLSSKNRLLVKADYHWQLATEVRPEGKMGRRSTKKSHGGTPRAPVNDDAIRFYRSNEKPYGAFSNLYRRSVEFEGVTYPTSEHAYQAGKALKPTVRDWIQAAPTPALAAMAAHGLYTWDVVPNWTDIKFDRMRRVLRAKFAQHADLAQLLISTGSRRLVESGTMNNAVNRLWGEVGGLGQNMLGVMLMEIRAELIQASIAPKPAARLKRRPKASEPKHVRSRRVLPKTKKAKRG